MRVIARLAAVGAGLGLLASIAAHGLSFQWAQAFAPLWFLAAFFGIFPLGAVGLYVCYRVGDSHGIWSGRDQWTFFERRLRPWWTTLRTIVGLYALLWLLLSAAASAIGTAADLSFPLGLFSAFTAAFYVTFLMILRVALDDPTLIAPTQRPLQPRSGTDAPR